MIVSQSDGLATSLQLKQTDRFNGKPYVENKKRISIMRSFSVFAYVNLINGLQFVKTENWKDTSTFLCIINVTANENRNRL